MIFNIQFFTIATLFFLFLIIPKCIVIVQQAECIVLERLGRYVRTLTSGLHFILPFIEKPRNIFWVKNEQIFLTDRLDLRETVLDIPSQTVITRDNVSIEIDAMLYIQIVDIPKAVYEISNLPAAIVTLAQTSLRNVIGEMDLDHTLASRDTINVKLKEILDDATDKWGTKVNRVELKNIKPPREIQVAMEKQMQAERERRAMVLQAEGDKQSKIARSEGQRQEQINLADGEKEAQIRRALGEAEAIKLVADAKKQAIHAVMDAISDPKLASQYLIATSYLESFEKFTVKSSDKVYVPYEATASLGALGMMADLLKQK